MDQNSQRENPEDTSCAEALLGALQLLVCCLERSGALQPGCYLEALSRAVDRPSIDPATKANFNMLRRQLMN